MKLKSTRIENKGMVVDLLVKLNDKNNYRDNIDEIKCMLGIPDMNDRAALDLYFDQNPESLSEWIEWFNGK